MVAEGGMGGMGAIYREGEISLSSEGVRKRVVTEEGDRRGQVR